MVVELGRLESHPLQRGSPSKGEHGKFRKTLKTDSKTEPRHIGVVVRIESYVPMCFLLQETPWL